MAHTDGTGSLRKANAQAMNAEQWSRIYGAPVPGQSRPVAEVLAERRRGAYGSAWLYAGPETEW